VGREWSKGARMEPRMESCGKPVPGREFLRTETPIFSLPCRFYAQKFSTSRVSFGLQLTVVVRNNHPAGPNH
jgi:hypothetical protein